MTPVISESQRDQAYREFRQIVGDAWVYPAGRTCDRYYDVYSLSEGDDRNIAGAVAPDSSAEVQAVVRAAARHGLPLWPISRGRNLGYGSGEPVLAGSIVLDLGRMNRILEVNERTGYCVLEPGVSFFDLFDHLQKNRIALWPSIPGHGWGSVVGNALERGLGAMPYGEHSTKLCGLEIVLPEGDVVRTGMGAMQNSRCWHQHQAGFGPAWDQVFQQSNFGVVTRAGMWLMPEPKATMQTRLRLENVEDLEWMIDALAKLRLRNVIEHPVTVGNFLHEAAVLSRRSDWFNGAGAIPEDTVRIVKETLGVGEWNLSLMFFGYPEIIECQAQIVRRTLEPLLGARLEFDRWNRNEPIERSAATLPGSQGLQTARWLGGRGAHVNFSPVLPPEGLFALGFAKQVQQRFAEFGLDYCASYTVGQRQIYNINTVLFDQDDVSSVIAAKRLMQALAHDASALGLGEYRTHIRFMTEASSAFDFNDHALRRLNERVKDALDPAGILAPGKSGIWPRKYRE